MSGKLFKTIRNMIFPHPRLTEHPFPINFHEKYSTNLTMERLLRQEKLCSQRSSARTPDHEHAKCFQSPKHYCWLYLSLRHAIALFLPRFVTTLALAAIFCLELQYLCCLRTSQRILGTNLLLLRNICDWMQRLTLYPFPGTSNWRNQFWMFPESH